MTRSTRIWLLAVFTAAVMFIGSDSVLAQCPMCRTAIEGSREAAAAAGRLNLAIVMLMIPSIVIFTAFFALIYRFRNYFGSAGIRNVPNAAVDQDTEDNSL